jgi:hypothetical protein
MISKTVFLSRPCRVLAVVLAVAFTLGMSQVACGQAAASGTSHPGVNANGMLTSGPLVAAEPAGSQTAGKDSVSKDSLQQGIKIHGHWTIDIKNLDGSLVEHREFENALQYDGGQLMAALLSGYGVMGGWEIYFTTNGGTSPCTGATFPYCAIVNSTTVQPGLFACSVYSCYPGITVTPTIGVPGPKVTIAGSMTSPGAGTIGTVGTGFNVCNLPASADSVGVVPTSIATTTPAACATATKGIWSGTATSTNIAPVSVAAGQIIQISVVLSFS